MCKCAGKLRLSDVQFIPLVGLAFFVGTVVAAGCVGLLMVQGVKTLSLQRRSK